MRVWLDTAKNDGCVRDKYRTENADIWQYTSSRYHETPMVTEMNAEGC